MIINEEKTKIDKILGERLNLPITLRTYEPFSSYYEDSSCIFNSQYKIVTYIDVSCGTCLGDLERWYELIAKLNNYDIPILVICGSVDNFQLFEYLCETVKEIDFPYPFFLDENNEFVSLNSFMKENNFRTVLIDKEYNILLLGNPIRSHKIKKIYFNKMKHLLN